MDRIYCKQSKWSKNVQKEKKNLHNFRGTRNPVFFSMQQEEVFLATFLISLTRPEFLYQLCTKLLLSEFRRMILIHSYLYPKNSVKAKQFCEIVYSCQSQKNKKQQINFMKRGRILPEKPEFVRVRTKAKQLL